MIRIADTPKQWMPKNTFRYPPHQGLNPLIEERALSYFSQMDIDSDFIYIPIQWTQYHCANNFGNDRAKVEELQNWANELPVKYPKEKFFTIVQYDDGTLVSIENCKVFAASNSPKSPRADSQEYIPIPMLSDPHPGSPKQNKMYKVGFAGRNNTHPIRKAIFDNLNELDGYKFFVNNNASKPEVFRSIIYDSVFGLAPRGYGPTSFRLYETIQMQAIPIYVSDLFWLPFEDQIEWDKLAVLVTPDRINDIPKIVDGLLESGEFNNYLEYGKKVYDQYLSWDGTLSQIAKIISK